MLKMASNNCCKKFRSEKSFTLCDVCVGFFTMLVIFITIGGIIFTRFRITDERQECHHGCQYLKVDEAPPKPSLDEKLKNTLLNPSDKILGDSRDYTNAKNDLKTKEHENNDPSSVESLIPWSMVVDYLVIGMILGFSICFAFSLVWIIYHKCNKKESSDYDNIDEIPRKMQNNVTFDREESQHKYQEIQRQENRTVRTS